VIGRADDRWSVGEAARASGLTVRALHHYDEIGLVRPSERTAAGHRRYTGRDLRRLYRIGALRALGLSLEEIAGVLAEPAEDLTGLREALTARLDALRAHAERVRRLQMLVGGLLDRLDDAPAPDHDLAMTILEMMSVFDTSFTPRQRERLAERRAALGPEAVEAAKAEWSALVEELMGHLEEGTPAGDPRVAALARRWDALAGRFHAPGADGEETRAAARAMWRDHGEELGRTLPWPADRMRALLAYLERARA
jgi:MerR family transcriptional regulator, thiopeptide resistance regulator